MKNVLKGYDEMKEEIENLKFKFKNQVYQIKFSLFIKQCYRTV